MCITAPANYHPITAKVYTDLSYFTCDARMCHDAAAMFNYMTGYAPPAHMDTLKIAPLQIRDTLVELIQAEMDNAQMGKPAQMWAKLNSLGR